jgi:type IV pilus assembly protein PilY1
VVLIAGLTWLGGPVRAETVAQVPLQAGGGLPGNLVLVPSVEFPTINSVANQGAYTAATVYTGYFDSQKCYQYQYSSTESERHFYPVSTTTTRTCTTAGAPWSGNFLNWAATQTIDPFRSALSGGYRVVDTPTETWLEKARQDGQMGTTLFPNRRLPGSGDSATMVQGATPFNVNWVRMRIQGLGNKMRLRVTNDGVDINVVPYNPGAASTDPSRLCRDNGCELSIRVKVCVPGLLEPNCKEYAQGWKPEGTLQEYADRMRYSVFGFLNDHDPLRDGGVLRARQKYIGPTLPGADGPEVNANREWDADTGVFVRNPDGSDATATSGAVGMAIGDSGVINYLNRFGQMTDKLHKGIDPVSELYYAALRYLKNLGNVPQYSALSGDALTKYQLADGFPVVTEWDDPVEHWCQSNTLLGIGDIYTHRDKNLPGSTCTSGEPSLPALVSSDATVSVPLATNVVGQMEGIGNIGSLCQFTGRYNSAYIAGLAWDARVRDLRPDLTGGTTTASTYWVDVLENQSLEGMSRNQYALAAKYGGARVPPDFDPDAWGNQPLPEGWWHSNGEVLTPFGAGAGQSAFKRPDNFFTAGEAHTMVLSLKKAFAQIYAETRGSGAALVSNSTKLETGARTFQAQFSTGTWRGELNAFEVDPDTGALSANPIWQAGSNVPAWGSRNIYFHNPEGSNAGQRYGLFTWDNLGSTQQGLLESEAVVNYLRGDRSQEEPDGSFRARTGVLGDIVHSEPVYVGLPNGRLYKTSTFNGSDSYQSFVSAQASRTPIVYVGANDGMLHGFNASTGVESYAFIPNQVIANGLETLASPEYQHRYFVDGEMTVADVYFSGGGGGWKTILVGTLGRGGPGLFALDVTNPSAVAFLWEKGPADIPALGRNIGKPIIAQVANGDWRVILGNGPDSPDEKAQLIMVGIQGGAVNVVDTGISAANGLSAVYTWDGDGDGFTDTAYAGDLAGNLWRFDNLAGSTTFFKLFEARDEQSAGQPISAAPLAGKDPDTGNRWVFFGTGRYLSEGDPLTTGVQTWYGLIDNGSTISGGRGDLLERSILAEGEINEFGVRVIEEGLVEDLAGKRGWYIDLVSPNNGAEGERMVVPNQFQGRVLIGTSRIPDASDVCRPTGRGFVMAIDPFTGGRLKRTFFDVTLDGLFNEADKLVVDGVPTIVSGVGFLSSPNKPLFIEHVMQVSLDDGTTESMQTQGSAVEARRTGWREVLGN